MSNLFSILVNQWKQFTEPMDYHLARATTLAQAQEWQQALPHYEKAIALRPQADPHLMLDLAHCLENLKRPAEAAEWYQKALQMQPQNAAAHRSLAKTLGDLGKVEKAIHHYQQTLELQPNQPPWVYFSLARMLVKVEQVEAAMGFYREALTRKPQNELGLYGEFGRMLVQHGYVPEAIALYEDAIQQHPDWAELYRGLASAQVQRGNQEAAIQNFLRSFLLKFDQPAWVYGSLEAVLSLYVHTQDILAAAAATVMERPQNPAAYYNLALIQSERGMLKPAIANGRKALEVAPAPSALVYKTLGDVLQADLQFDAAIAAYTEAHALAPDTNVRLYNNWGTLYCKMQRWTEAEAQLQKAIDVATGMGVNEQTYFKLHHVQLKQQKHDAAAVTQQRWAARYYLVNHRHKMILCPLHKNAVTLFKNIIVRQSDYAEEWEAYQGNIHHFIGKQSDKFSLQDFALTQDPSYFKFAVLRNPFDRIVSAYFDKFAKYENIDLTARPVVVAVHKSLGMEPDIQKSITFRQFVQYLAETEDFLLDEHWRPQHSFLCQNAIHFDFIGQFENLEETVQTLEKQFGFTVKTKVTPSGKKGFGHITHYESFEEGNAFHDLYPQQLRQLGAFPKPIQMYTAELRSLVETRFKEDLDLYRQRFGSVAFE